MVAVIRCLCWKRERGWIAPVLAALIGGGLGFELWLGFGFWVWVSVKVAVPGDIVV